MPKNAFESIRFIHDSKNAIGICYESSTLFRSREFVAKVLNSSKLLSRIPDRPRKTLQELTTVCTIHLRFSRNEYVSVSNPNICKFVAIRGI